MVSELPELVKFPVTLLMSLAIFFGEGSYKTRRSSIGIQLQQAYLLLQQFKLL